MNWDDNACYLSVTLCVERGGPCGCHTKFLSPFTSCTLRNLSLWYIAVWYLNSEEYPQYVYNWLWHIPLTSTSAIVYLIVQFSVTNFSSKAETVTPLTLTEVKYGYNIIP